mgnify:CR=1 FL=1
MNEVHRLQLPSFYEISAETSWKTIDFISDVHLRAEDTATFEAWKSYMLRSRADAIFILGDLFEAWVGDDVMQQAFEAACVEVLEAASAGKQLAFMVGNRDFLVGSKLLKHCGMLALSSPTRLMAWDQPILLIHGDELCLGDEPYQAFRQEVRQEAWQDRFLALPLSQRLSLAKEMRDASKSSQAARGSPGKPLISDIDTSAAVAWMHQAGCKTLVHGHTHQPGTEVMAPGYTRHVLSDWDMHSSKPRAEALRLTRDGFNRLHAVRA